MVVLRLGELLVKAGKLTPETLEKALKEAKREGLKLGDYLVKAGYIDKNDLYETLASQIGVPYLRKVEEVSSQLIQRFPKKKLKEWGLVPLLEDSRSVWVGFYDPTSLLNLNEISNAFDKPIQLFLIDEDTFNEIVSKASAVDIADEDDIAVLLQEILEAAVENTASDIHFERDKGGDIRVRFRINGVLTTVKSLKQPTADNVIRRVKVVGGMDVTDDRIPQDGSFVFNFGKIATYEVRVVTIPTVYGEEAVLRILGMQNVEFDLEVLGFNKDDAKLLEIYSGRNAGMIVVAGPTGSGKTTTLYTILQKLIGVTKRKVISIEDPVEYRFDWLTQIQVNKAVGLDFAKALRSVLRADPDVIMVGEIRDSETAHLACEAALTGHLVLTTIHTYDVAEIPIRLIQMGVPSYIVAGSLDVLIAQRLLKRLCPYCKRRVEDPQIVEMYGDGEWSEAVGCDKCGHTGVAGRILVYQMLQVDAALREAIENTGSKVEFEKRAQIGTLRSKALELARKGEISIKEVLTLK